MTITKSELRLKMITKREHLSLTDRSSYANIVYHQIINLAQVKKANTIGVYASHKDEIDTQKLISTLISLGKTVALPKVVNQDLSFFQINNLEDCTPGFIGILEPPPIQEIKIGQLELIIVHGLAFNHQGYRLGYGKGYTDRLFLQSSAFKIGVCYPFQIVDHIPLETHDQKVDLVIC